MDRGTWQATVHGSTKSQMQLSMHQGLGYIRDTLNSYRSWFHVDHACVLRFGIKIIKKN